MQFKIFITVGGTDIESFKESCLELDILPRVVETEKDGVFSQQLITHSNHTCKDDFDYMPTLLYLTASLISKGHKVIREKVDTFARMGPHRDFVYAESHVKFKLPKNFNKTALIEYCKSNGFHLSMDSLKKPNAFDWQIVTYRQKSMDYLKMAKVTDAFVLWLGTNDIECDKKEFRNCIFDSNIALDDEWMGNFNVK